ncbi:unnamed protein product [Oikopleura dioica]|uniref:Uncharacterized protein n=1 Tax=Oikopleura dioica TaxID=34765 RepID=E4Y7D2_OIKDI|nr:unnamed protein product [Oikopleura dioica]
MEQIVSLWYKICYYKDLSVIGTFEEALKNFAAMDSFRVLANMKALEFDDVMIWPWMEMINLTHWEVVQRHDTLKTYISNKSKLEPMKLTKIPADVFKRFAVSHNFDIDL